MKVEKKKVTVIVAGSNPCRRRLCVWRQERGQAQPLHLRSAQKQDTGNRFKRESQELNWMEKQLTTHSVNGLCTSSAINSEQLTSAINIWTKRTLLTGQEGLTTVPTEANATIQQLNPKNPWKTGDTSSDVTFPVRKKLITSMHRPRNSAKQREKQLHHQQSTATLSSPSNKMWSLIIPLKLKLTLLI